MTEDGNITKRILYCSKSQEVLFLLMVALQPSTFFFNPKEL